jgi:hypothetical protein
MKDKAIRDRVYELRKSLHAVEAELLSIRTTIGDTKDPLQTHFAEDCTTRLYELRHDLHNLWSTL